MFLPSVLGLAEIEIINILKLKGKDKIISL
jgi:hypothetical protein